MTDKPLNPNQGDRELHKENPYHEEIGEAWKAHRNGFQDTAIEQFREVLEQDSENVDAMYGLGLAKKANGNILEARQTFDRLYDILEKYVQKESAEGKMERYYMLRNMVERLMKQMEEES